MFYTSYNFWRFLTDFGAGREVALAAHWITAPDPPGEAALAGELITRLIFKHLEKRISKVQERSHIFLFLFLALPEERQSRNVAGRDHLTLETS